MEGSDYNFLMRLFHRMTLGSKAVSEMSFDLEKSLFMKKQSSDITNGNHVFVSGLARSGTTALMRCLHEQNELVSLTYKDMPFILAPNLWSKITSNQKSTELIERAHKDGIFINNESPEAFDEVFWKVFLNESYILKDRLLINELTSEILDDYRHYIDLILRKNYQGKRLRYLSKNNNNILRLNSILQKFPDSFVIIPFRDPLQQAISLLNQHIHFSKTQQKDRFSLKYMNWIGHHEFGLNQKPFFLNNKAISEQMAEYVKEDINYWLLTWLNYYNYVLDYYSETCILFSYEQFCKDPKYLSKLLHKINLINSNVELTPFDLIPRKCNNVDVHILNKCNFLYSKLTELS